MKKKLCLILILPLIWFINLDVVLANEMDDCLESAGGTGSYRKDMKKHFESQCSRCQKIALDVVKGTETEDTLERCMNNAEVYANGYNSSAKKWCSQYGEIEELSCSYLSENYCEQVLYNLKKPFDDAFEEYQKECGGFSFDTEKCRDIQLGKTISGVPYPNSTTKLYTELTSQSLQSVKNYLEKEGCLDYLDDASLKSLDNLINVYSNLKTSVEEGDNVTYQKTVEDYKAATEALEAAMKGKNVMELTQTPCDIMASDTKFGKILLEIIGFIRIAGIILCVLLGMFDFVKSVTSGKDDSNKKNRGNFIKRLIAVVILLILPVLLQLVFDNITVTNDEMCEIETEK